MPFKEITSYRPLRWLRNGHSNTMASFLYRQGVDDPFYQRTRIDTPDQDFLDLDFAQVGSHNLIIVLHGLEGSSGSGYIKTMVRAIHHKGWDALVVNMRGCSGEPNRTYSSYHSGKSDDLDTVVKYVLENYHYHRIGILGFSLGGNITLRYMGEQRTQVPEPIKGGVAISVPCDLGSTAIRLSDWDNIVYLKRFLKDLKAKAYEKKKNFPDAPFTIEEIESVKSFKDFDDLYTGSAHGFGDAQGYWDNCSSTYVVDQIERPTLLINAWDDPFLTPECFPREAAENNPDFFFNQTKYGGHVGFSNQGLGDSWHEAQALYFLEEQFRKSLKVR